MTAVRIVGIGSPFAGDDSGWRLAEALAAAGFTEHFPKDMVDIVLCATPGQLLLGPLRDLRCAILFDAVPADEIPGRISMIPVGMLCRKASLTSHGLSVADTLALADALNMLPPDLAIYGIAVDLRRPNPPMAALVADIAPALSAYIRTVIPPCDGAPWQGDYGGLGS